MTKFHHYIYNCEKSIEVYKKSMKYIDNNEEYLSKIDELGWSYSAVGTLIPHTTENLWSGHFFPWAESWDELQVSFNLCLFGLYKQAMVSLRSGLELGLLSVYWNLNDDGHQIIKEWLKSEKDTPRLDEIWKKLERHRNFHDFQRQCDLKWRLLKLGFLHNYVHSKGYEFSNYFGLSKTNFQTFEYNAFEKWLETYEEVIKVLTVLHLIKYPLGSVKYDYASKFGIDVPSFGGIDEFEVELIEKMIGSELFGIIKQIAEDDERTQAVLKYINEKKDITEDEVQQQIICHDKFMIENMGLEGWLRMHDSYPDSVKKDENYQKRLKLLTTWAKKQGSEKPKHERNL
jgi:hypothetical protein